LPGLPAPPPRQALPGDYTRPYLSVPSQDAAARQVEEAVRWGPHGTSRRSDNPRRNAHGFAEGDRYRYLKTDQFVTGSHGVTDYLWTVDRIEPDGSLWVNGGRQRLDPAGQRTGGNDEHTGEWLDYSPALPLLELAKRGDTAALPFNTTVRVRAASGLVEVVALSGMLRTSPDAVRGPRGVTDLLPAVKIEVDLMGTAQRSDGAMRALNWKHTYWMALPLLLPVAFEILEVADGLPRQRTRHELVAIDQLSLSELAAANPSGGTR
jgi:hypothetical protein